MQSIIEKTAIFINRNGVQMEIVLKTKQAGNPQFDFLAFGNWLNPYYKFILDMIKEGSFTEDQCSKDPEKKDVSDSSVNKGSAKESGASSSDEHDDDENEDELHPLLQAHRRPVNHNAVSTMPTPTGDPVFMGYVPKTKHTGKVEDLRRVYMAVKYKKEGSESTLSDDVHSTSENYLQNELEEFALNELISGCEVVEPPSEQVPTSLQEQSFLPSASHSPISQRNVNLLPCFRPLSPPPIPGESYDRGGDPEANILEDASKNYDVKSCQHTIATISENTSCGSVRNLLRAASFEHLSALNVKDFSEGDRDAASLISPSASNQLAPAQTYLESGALEPRGVESYVHPVSEGLFLQPSCEHPSLPDASYHQDIVRSGLLFERGHISNVDIQYCSALLGLNCSAAHSASTYLRGPIGGDPLLDPSPFFQRELHCPGFLQENPLTNSPKKDLHESSMGQIFNVPATANCKAMPFDRFAMEKPLLRPPTFPPPPSVQRNSDVISGQDVHGLASVDTNNFQDAAYRSLLAIGATQPASSLLPLAATVEAMQFEPSHSWSPLGFSDSAAHTQSDPAQPSTLTSTTYASNVFVLPSHADSLSMMTLRNLPKSVEVFNDYPRHSPVSNLLPDDSLELNSGVRPNAPKILRSKVALREAATAISKGLHSKQLNVESRLDLSVPQSLTECHMYDDAGFTLSEVDSSRLFQEPSPNHPSDAYIIGDPLNVQTSRDTMRKFSYSSKSQKSAYAFADAAEDDKSPPPDLKPVIDRLALYVARNGETFEAGIRSKKDPRFDFLNTQNVYYGYYQLEKKKRVAEIEEQKAKVAERKNLKVKFGLKGKGTSSLSRKVQPGQPAVFNQAEDSESDEEVHVAEGFVPRKDHVLKHPKAEASIEIDEKQISRKPHTPVSLQQIVRAPAASCKMKPQSGLSSDSEDAVERAQRQDVRKKKAAAFIGLLKSSEIRSVSPASIPHTHLPVLSPSKIEIKEPSHMLRKRAFKELSESGDRLESSVATDPKKAAFLDAINQAFRHT